MRTMKNLYAIMAGAAIFLGASCTGRLQSLGEGELRLHVDFENSSKAAMSERELSENAIVNIYKADFTGLVRSFVNKDMPESVFLASDEYRVDVIAGELSKKNPAVVSWEQKSYKGSEHFTVSPDRVADVSVEAKVCNTITEIAFDPTIAANFREGYKFTIGFDLAGADIAEYNASNSGSRAYFLTEDVEPSLFWKFEGVRARTGDTVVKRGEIESVAGGTVYRLVPKFTSNDGGAGFDITVDCSTDEIDDLIVFVPLSSGLSASRPYEIWATKATVHAEVDESEFTESSRVQFSYSKDGVLWTEIDADRLEPGTYEALLKELDPATQYTYRLLIDGVQTGDSMTFMTGDAAQPENPGFEVFSNAESSKFKSFYDPADALWKTKWWDNGNHGSTTLSASQAVCVPDSSTKMEGEYSARCASQYVVVKFAAGSISTCEYAGTEGTNGKVNFGRPFTARPSAVRLWAKYNGGEINRGDYSGQPDYATFIVALGTWPSTKYKGSKNCPLQVYTADKNTYWNYAELPETIAYGYYETTGIEEWTRLTIPFDYYKTDEFPTHIVLSFAASKYGDYFSGCDSAVLWVDGVELLYE